jgi:hypothetical protein
VKPEAKGSSLVPVLFSPIDEFDENWIQKFD